MLSGQWEEESLGFHLSPNMLKASLKAIVMYRRTKAAVNQHWKPTAAFRFHVILSNFWLCAHLKVLAGCSLQRSQYHIIKGVK